jgi:hypothetical protein
MLERRPKYGIGRSGIPVHTSQCHCNAAPRARLPTKLVSNVAMEEGRDESALRLYYQ